MAIKIDLLKIIRAVIFTAMILILVNCSNEILNLDSARNQVREYYEGKGYRTELEEIVRDAMDELKSHTADDSSVVIFDVDDTVLSSYYYTSSIGFGYIEDEWNKWIMKAQTPAIEPVKKFYDWLIERNYRVIFLTGRDESLYEATHKNLLNAGFTEFDTLICRNDEEKNIPASEYKTARRIKLTGKGYRIAACVGDQESDLEGEYTGIKIKLPNYLYLIN